MPVTKITRQGVISAPRDVPTETTATVMPMTLDRVGAEAPEDDTPTKISTLADAFKTFKPAIDFSTQVGEEGTEFVAQLEFKSIGDFDPKQIRSRAPGKRNDIADLHSQLELLQRMRASFALLPVKRAWEKEADRTAVIDALQAFKSQIQRIADGEGGAK